MKILVIFSVVVALLSLCYACCKKPKRVAMAINCNECNEETLAKDLRGWVALAERIEKERDEVESAYFWLFHFLEKNKERNIPVEFICSPMDEQVPCILFQSYGDSPLPQIYQYEIRVFRKNFTVLDRKDRKELDGFLKHREMLQNEKEKKQ
jgi:hypothetical protein